jgi:hypothetical protein
MAEKAGALNQEDNDPLRLTVHGDYQARGGKVQRALRAVKRHG